MIIKPALCNATSSVLQRDVLEALPLFWGGRDVRALHHPVWFRQFADSAFTAREPDGALRAYLLGCVSQRVAYVHAVATHPDARRTSLARSLYEHFLSMAEVAGCASVEAVTTPGNQGSVKFHERLGFAWTLVPDYAGPGEDRVHFLRYTSHGQEG